MRKNILQDTIDGKDTYGVYLSIPSPALVEICKFAGYDYIRLDMEHSLYSPSEIRECLRTALSLEIPAWVRVANRALITPLLDMGATGIVIPDVKCVKDVEPVVELVKYAPVGMRGMMPSGRLLRYGLDPITPAMETANREVCIVAQLESQEALDHIDEILSVPGLDMVSVGKQDMSQSLGVAGQGGHPKVVAAENFQIQKTIAAGKYPAPLVTSPERMAAFRQMGVHCFTVGYDTTLLINAFAAERSKYKEQ